MKFGVKFTENVTSFEPDFGEVHNISDGGYERGYADGKADGYGNGYTVGTAEGIEQGEQAEWSAFWDKYQDYGNRTDYNMYVGAFNGDYWTDEIFKPKYPIAPTNAQQMFRRTGITDLTKEGVILDFSKCVNMNDAFAYLTHPIKLPVIDMSSATSCSATFSDSKNTELSLITSEKTVFHNITFSGCTALVNLIISGVIACAFNVQYSTKLSRESIESIINALSTTTTGLTATFSKTAVNKAFATTTGGSNGSTSAEWLALVATRSNWTIALA